MLLEPNEAKESKQLGALIDGSRLLDDNLMTLVFDGNIEAAQLVLNIILGRADLIVKTVTVQKLEKSPLYNGRDVKIDIFAEDSDGDHFDIEVQRADEGADKTRVRVNSAQLDVRMLKHRQKFKEIKDSYVIFITENDVLGKGRALSHIDRYVLEDNEEWGDGNHIIYANAAYPDTSSDIGKLMHDFRCRKPEDMYYEPLRKSVYYFKKTERGRKKMSKDIEKYADEKAIESVVTAYRDAKLSDDDIKKYIMKKFELSEKEAKKYLEPIYA